MEVEVDKQCIVSLNPKTVPPLNSKGASIQTDQLLTVKGCSDSDRRINRYRIASCPLIPYRLGVLEGHMEPKRGSVYEASRQETKMKRVDVGVSRRKIEISRGSDTGSEHADSLCCLNRDGKQERFQDLLVHPALIRASATRPDEEACSTDGFFDIPVDLNDRLEPIDDGPVSDANGLNATQTQVLDYSYSCKLETPQPYSTCQSINTPQPHSSRQSVDALQFGAGTKSRSSPIKKMMDTVLKSKSHRSPLNLVSGGQYDEKTRCRLLWNNTLPNPVSCNSPDTKGHVSSSPNSPSLLHASFTLRTKHGIPLFIFTKKCPEVSFLARTWKWTRNSDTGSWVYTFHSFNRRMHRDFKRGSIKHTEELPLVGQMQVSSRICPESGSNSEKLLVTEFLLYDTANASSSKVTRHSSHGGQDISDLPTDSYGTLDNWELNLKNIYEDEAINLKPDRNASLPDFAYPWESAKLHTNLESAAVIIRIPVEKRESLKLNEGVKASEYSLPDTNIVSKSGPCDSIDVIAVTSAGSHSSPNAENEGPSSLLERWRVGGGCECGGWDMGCPLTVYSNPASQNASSLSDKQSTDQFELLVQGERSKSCALSIKVVKEGRYDVVFHARLSALQAFSICVAMVHALEPTNSALTPLCSPRKLKESHTTMTLNPPISPMSRV